VSTEINVFFFSQSSNVTGRFLHYLPPHKKWHKILLLELNKFYRFALNAVELGFNVTKGTEYSVLLKTSVVLTEKYNVAVNCEELTGTTEYLTV